MKIDLCNGLLVFLHGCIGGKEYVGTNVITEAGFLEELEYRNIIGLFPQIKRSVELNPYGCWNFFGYLPDDKTEYYTKDGIQTRILRRMINQLSGKKVPK